MGKVRKGAWNIHKVTPRLDELQARPVYRCESRRKARQPAHANEGRTVLSPGQGRLSAMKDGVLPTLALWVRGCHRFGDPFQRNRAPA